MSRDLEGLMTENADLRRRVHALEGERTELQKRLDRQERALGALAARTPLATVHDVEEAVRRTVGKALQQMLHDGDDSS